MRLNIKQQDEFAKHLWDLSKITYAILVVGLVARKEDFNAIGFVGGFITSIGLIFAALFLRITKRRKK